MIENYDGPERRKEPRPKPLDVHSRLTVKDWWLVVLSAMAVVALFGAVLGFIRDSEQEKTRNEDRVAFDLASCLRGNQNRINQRQLAQAGAQLDRDILDVFFVTAPPAVVAKINERLAPSFDRYQAFVDKIKTVDCQALVKVPARDTVTTTTTIRVP